jgi:Type IV secretion-system coupling protein DNA-binding domain
MKNQWGRKHHSQFPTDTRSIWLLSIPVLVIAAMGAAWVYQYRQLTPLQQYWFPLYLNADFMSTFKFAKSNYRLLTVEKLNGRFRLPEESDIAPGVTRTPGGRNIPFVLTEEAASRGERLVLQPSMQWDNGYLEQQLTDAIYNGKTIRDMGFLPNSLGVLLFAIGVIVVIPRERARNQTRLDGRRLKGPELVTTAEFNRRNRSDGIGFFNTERRTFGEWILRRKGNIVCVPTKSESSHFLIMGDSGTGKSALIRQLLNQIEERNETAIVYDPALEYTPEFYNPERGDLILNPLDKRMPFWSPGDEIQHEAEALTLAASLFPDSQRENPFFVEGPRKVFAHLLTLKPSPEELTSWLCHEEKLDRRLKGTELAAMIYHGAAAQRAGILAALNMVADSLKVLPRKPETTRTWTAGQWSQSRQGWLFLTSTPEIRKRLLPLTSMWLDLLVLRLMNQGRPGPRPVWFILDELASLQRLPQLHTAITENRKSNNPVVLGFQGRSQLEARYGMDAEAMFSQPATKIFLRTSEPKSARWISETIGEVEIEKMRESRTEGQERDSRTYQLERHVEPLVMASEISGLAPLQGYFKHGNLVVRLSTSYICRDVQAKGFIPRNTRTHPQPLETAAMPPLPPTAGKSTPPVQSQTPGEQQQEPYFE